MISNFSGRPEDLEFPRAAGRPHSVTAGPTFCSCFSEANVVCTSRASRFCRFRLRISSLAWTTAARSESRNAMACSMGVVFAWASNAWPCGGFLAGGRDWGCRFRHDGFAPSLVGDARSHRQP